MKNVIKYFVLLLLSIVFNNQIIAQSVTAGINPLTLPCGGGQVNLTAVGNSQTPVFGDNFNNGGLQPGWSTNVTADFSNPCGAPVDGTTYLWMGSSATAPRALNTASVDVSCGGQICFDFKFMCESCGDSAPCEGADAYNEGVGLQYSTDGGATWTTFSYFAPNGNILGNVPTTTSPYASGNTPFTTWQNYCFNIPPGAFGPNTIFRLRQFNSSSQWYDHWGVDNFYVYATPCAPFYYDWEQIPGAPDPADVTANVTQTTTFTVHYTNGIVDYTDQVTVVVASISILNVNITPEACLGDNNASITTTVDVTGGTAPFNYTLAGPTTGSNSTGSFTGLSPGLYTLTLSDGGGCTDTYNFTINPGPACCSVTATGTDPLCNGSADGTATANPANGQPPYTYVWTNGQTTQTATGLAAGTYSVTITDANGCTSTASVTLGQPTVVTATTTPTNVTCFGGADGQVTVNAPSGGTPGYTYSINGGAFQNSATFTGLIAGNYTITVKDNNGCTITLTQTITEPTDVTLAETNNTPATCGMSNGETTVSASGGTGSYTYDLGGTTNGTGNFIGLAPGNYTITVTDGSGCTETLNIIIGNSAGPVPTVDATSAVACAGGLNGSVSINVAGGQSPYTYSLDGGTSQGSNTFTLAAGAHTVTVTDFNSCTGSVTFNITEPSPLVFNTTISPTLCNASCDGQITVNASGSNGGYSYSIDGGPFLGSNSFTNLCAGNYNIVVQDVNGCSANSNEVVTEPAAITSTFTFVEPSCFGVCDAEIHMANTAGGDGNYLYSVDGGANFQASPDFLNQCAGNFDIVVQDGNGCQGVFSGSVVTTPPQITFTTNFNNPSNCGAQDGSFSMTATNGTPSYTYYIHNSDYSMVSPPQTNNGLFPNLFSGLYTIVVTDGNGCMDSSFVALQDQDMTSTLQIVQDSSCYHSNEGVAVVTIVTGGGAGAAQFVLNTFANGFQIGPQANGIFPNLPAGDHTITVTKGICTNILQFTITERDTIQFNAVAADVSCPSNATNVANDGTITFSNAVGGLNTTYEYSIDGGITYQASPNFTGLAPGTYVLFARDPNGCEGQSTIDINQPADFSVNTNVTDLTCNGDNTGFLQVFAAGGTANYTYDLNGTSNGTGIFAGLPANPNYNITITDNLMCTFSSTEAINEPAVLTANYVVTDANCNGVCDGEILVSANGGTPVYLYSADNGVTYQSSNNLVGLCAGNHQVRVKDDHNCVVDATQTVIEPSLITFNMTSTPATCGNDNATVTINANNGTPNYQYSASTDNGVTFTPLQSATTITNLPAVNTIIMVTDANSCEVTQNINLSADPLPVIDFVQTTDPLCNGDANGIIEITASGGVTPYQYSVDNGNTFQGSNVFNTLTDGNYTIVVQDANNCQTSTTADLTHPAILQLNVSGTDLLCNGDFTGEINASVQGGTTPYLYSIDGGVTTQAGGMFSYVAANNYTVDVTDFNGCTVSANQIINEPNTLAWTQFDIVDPNCFGTCDGSVTTALTGGTSPYTYNWSSAIATSSDAIASNVCSGTYSVLVADDHGCQVDSLNFVLADPLPVSITSILPTEVSCHSLSVGSNPNLNSDGSINITVPAQTPPINQFSIDGGTTFQNSNVFNGLTPGNYDVVAQNSNGCSVTFSTSIGEPDELLGGVPPNSDVCFGEDVLINPLLTTGGTLDYSYTWNISDGTTVTSETFNMVITQPTTFNLEINDANNCYAGVYTYELSPTPQLTVVASNDVHICPGETTNISAVANGGQLIDFNTVFDYSYSWSPATPIDTLNNLDVTPTLDSNAYIITVVDACNAIAKDTVVVFLYEDPTPILVGGGVGCLPYEAHLLNVGDVVQNGGSVVWNLGDGTTISNQDSISYLYQSDGCYDVTLTITTVNGCTSDSTYADLICVNPNPIAQFDFLPALPTTSNQLIQFNNMSEGATSYFWTFDNLGNSSEENPEFEFNANVETTYDICLEVVSDMGCTDTICHPLTVYEELIFYVPNVFTPDHDDYNESFQPIFTSGFDPYDYHLTIFNRWGEIVFESYNAQVGWDGTYGNGEICQDGVYVWQINFGESISDKKHNYRGHVTLLK